MKKSVGKKKAVKNKTMLDNLPKNRGEYLELLIQLTERAISPGLSDKGMVAQASRLNKELKDWKKASNL